jgi:hypothetical protein
VLVRFVKAYRSHAVGPPTPFTLSAMPDARSPSLGNTKGAIIATANRPSTIGRFNKPKIPPPDDLRPLERLLLERRRAIINFEFLMYGQI